MKHEESKENKGPFSPNTLLPINKKQRASKKPLETISEERKAFIEKDDKVQKRIIIREEKLEMLKEKSLKKDSELTAKEQELHKLRERTRLLMQKAKEKEENFSKEEKEFQSTLEKAPKEGKTRLDKILAKANEKANAMKEEMRRKRACEDEDNLLSFLRKSHKKGGSIYSFIEDEKKENAAIPVKNQFIESDGASHEDSENIACDNFYKPTTSKDIKKAVQQSIDKKNQHEAKSLKRVETVQVLNKPKENEHSERKSLSKKTDTPASNSQFESIGIPKLKTQSQNKEGHKMSSINFYLPTSPCPSRASSFKDIDSDWSSEVENSISKLEKALPNKNYPSREDTEVDLDNNEESVKSFRGSSDVIHYSERWSMSPVAQEKNERHSRTKLRPLDKPPIIINGRVHSPRRNESRDRQQQYGPQYGKLCRRKSLSDNCLLSKSKQQNENSTLEKDLDAFGIPRIPRQKRSVSLMRETFIKKPAPETYNTKEKQRRISHETRTSSAAEFKTLFETGSASQSNRNSRSNTPCKPIQVKYLSLLS